MIAVAVRNRELAETEQALHAEQEAGTADSADENGGFHTDRH